QCHQPLGRPVDQQRPGVVHAPGESPLFRASALVIDARGMWASNAQPIFTCRVPSATRTSLFLGPSPIGTFPGMRGFGGFNGPHRLLSRPAQATEAATLPPGAVA